MKPVRVTNVLGRVEAADWLEKAQWAAGYGQPVVPALMLLARDSERPLTRYAAIYALWILRDTIVLAREALTRIERLPVKAPIDRIYREAAQEPYRRGPYSHWAGQVDRPPPPVDVVGYLRDLMR